MKTAALLESYNSGFNEKTRVWSSPLSGFVAAGDATRLVAGTGLLAPRGFSSAADISPSYSIWDTLTSEPQHRPWSGAWSWSLTQSLLEASELQTTSPLHPVWLFPSQAVSHGFSSRNSLMLAWNSSARTFRVSHPLGGGSQDTPAVPRSDPSGAEGCLPSKPTRSACQSLRTGYTTRVLLLHRLHIQNTESPDKTPSLSLVPPHTTLVTDARMTSSKTENNGSKAKYVNELFWAKGVRVKSEPPEEFNSL